MSFLSFGKKEKQVSLVVDVGNSTITCALVLFNEKELPVFLYISTENIVLNDVPQASRLIDSMISKLDSQLINITKRGFTHKYWSNNSKNIESAIISFSSPWFISKTKHINIANENDFIISEKFLDNVIDKEEVSFVNELTANTNDTFEIVEKNIIHTKINGYSLTNPIGKKTKNIDAFVCLSAMDRGIVEKVYDSILRYGHIHKEKIAIHTFPLVAFSVIRDFFSGVNDFLIMDITGDMTDMTLVQDSVIMQTTTMPSGRNFILRQISKAFDVPIEIAESLLHLYNSEIIDDSQKVKMQEVITQVEKEWAIYFENSLLEISPTLSLPENLYLMASSDVTPIYNSFLQLSKVDATASFRKTMNLTNIDENSVKDFCKNESPYRADEFISFVALFYKKILNL